MSSKDCSEVSSIKRVAASTLQEKQYLAKQQSFVNKITGNDPDRRANICFNSYFTNIHGHI